jgi:hypothetical protein
MIRRGPKSARNAPRVATTIAPTAPRTYLFARAAAGRKRVVKKEDAGAKAHHGAAELGHGPAELRVGGEEVGREAVEEAAERRHVEERGRRLRPGTPFDFTSP